MKFLRLKILSYLDEEPSSPQHQSIVKVGVYFNMLTIQILTVLACVEYGKEHSFTIIEIKLEFTVQFKIWCQFGVGAQIKHCKVRCNVILN